MDYKYNLLKHPNIRCTEDGGAAPYDYTAADNARDDLPGAPENYELLDMDDFLPAEAAEMKPTMYAAIAPIPLSTFAGEPTSSVGKNFIRSYAGVCLQGVVIALSCIIFSAISSSPPAVDTGASVVTAVWTYVGELAFNLLVLVGAIKGCDRIVKEIMGL